MRGSMYFGCFQVIFFSVCMFIVFIVLMTMMEIAARTGCFDEEEEENKNNSKKTVILNQRKK